MVGGELTMCAAMHLAYAMPLRTPQETAQAVRGADATTAHAFTCTANRYSV
jgi:hypothetical protein